MRDLNIIIDKLINTSTSANIKLKLTRISTKLCFTAPEVYSVYWKEVQDVLDKEYLNMYGNIKSSYIMNEEVFKLYSILTGKTITELKQVIGDASDE